MSSRHMRRVPIDFPVSMWLVDLAVEPCAEEMVLLSQAERDRAARFRVALQRTRYLRLHGALRLAVAQDYALPPEDQRYVADALGRWRVIAPIELQLSFSYSGGYGAIALSRDANVGIDIEEWRPVRDADSLTGICFDTDEQVMYSLADGRDRDTAFLAGWTRKEAALKAIGTGFQRPPDTLHTGLFGRSATQTDAGRIELLSFTTVGLIGAVAAITREQGVR